MCVTERKVKSVQLQVKGKLCAVNRTEEHESHCCLTGPEVTTAASLRAWVVFLTLSQQAVWH